MRRFVAGDAQLSTPILRMASAAGQASQARSVRGASDWVRLFEHRTLSAVREVE
jgi:hypothetical protein